MDDILDEVTRSVLAGNLAIPTLPDSVTRILQKLNNVDDIDEVVSIISIDQVIAAKIMQCASSAYLSRSNLKSLKQAIVRLGIDSIRSIVTAVGIEMSYAVTDNKLAYYLKKQWLQNVSIMATSMSILKYSKYANKISADEVLLLSLCHSIGIIPIVQQLSSVGQVNLSNLSPLVCEHVLDISSHIVSAWGFNPVYSSYISNLGYGSNTGAEPTPTDIVLAAYCAQSMDDLHCKEFDILLMNEGDSILSRDIMESRRASIQKYTE